MQTSEWKDHFEKLDPQTFYTVAARDIIRELFPGFEKPLNGGTDNRRTPVYPSAVYNLGRALMAYSKLLEERGGKSVPRR